MAEMPYVHIGIIVPELEPAMAHYSHLGFTFMEPRTVHVDRLVDGGRELELDLRVVFSHQGPPHLEFLEATGDGIYGPQHIGGLHHVAILHPDPGGRSKELESLGMRSVAAQYRSDGSTIVVYVESANLHGVRIELLHEPVGDAILSWVAGQDATP